ncbi:MauE/DoxX family redox-associated membrane protein [Actinomadura miaoliensis]|uniref:Methylamine utilisation protein MauE domain-containing protein n=1 Tax=Actinomadura miaoliensis TaxID=430685 RepID=A0ABP7X6R8_9ACTN
MTAGLAAGIAAVTVPVVLAVSLWGHARRPGVLVAAVRAHGTVPGPLVRPVAALAVAAEAVTGAGAAAGLLLGLDDLLCACLALAAVLLGAYALYGTYVARTRTHAVPCGCAGDASTPMTGWVAVRAGALAVLALAGAVWGPPASRPPAESLIVVAMGLVWAVLLWSLPPAMAQERERSPAG